MNVPKYYYKFRVFFDDIEDFVRDIEILSTDQFESFHNILISSIGLQNGELASFSICDPKWNKQKEITLIDMGDDDEVDEPEYDEDDDYSTGSHLPCFVMRDAILKDFIADPHQKLIYEYDFLNPKVFYIELLKTLQLSENGKTDATQFPQCTYRAGELAKETPKLPVAPLEELFCDEDCDIDADFDDGFNEEDHLDLSSLDEFAEF